MFMRKKVLEIGIAICLFSAIAFVSCKKEKQENPSKRGKVSIFVESNDNMPIATSKLKSANTLDFKVDILDAGNIKVLSYNKLSDVPSSIELNKGEYYVAVYSDNQNSTPAFDNPIYYGQSSRFKIEGNDQKSITVRCYITNVKVSVIYSDTVKSNFTDYSVKVFQNSDTLTFGKDDTREGYFKPGDIGIKAILKNIKTDQTTELKILSANIASARAMKHYVLRINASVIKGTGSISVVAIDSMQTETVIISETPQPTPKTSATVTAGDILITEVMPNPDKISDDFGEWIELYNNSGVDVNVKGLKVKVGTKTYTLTKDVTIKSGQYIVLATNAQAVAEPFEIYGSVLSLVNTNGSVQVLASDGITEIASMTYSSCPTGGSLSLNPDKFNYSDAKLAASWCHSVSVYSTGDKGTPGAANDSCN